MVGYRFISEYGLMLMKEKFALMKNSDLATTVKSRGRHLQTLRRRRRQQVLVASRSFRKALKRTQSSSSGQNQIDSFASDFVRITSLDLPLQRRLTWAAPNDNPNQSGHQTNDYEQEKIDLSSNRVLSDSYIEALDKPLQGGPVRPRHAEATQRLVSRPATRPRLAHH